MGKISDALNKAGYKDGVESISGDELSEVFESKPSSRAEQSNENTEKDEEQLSINSKPKESTQRANVAEAAVISGRWDDRLYKGVNDNMHLVEVFKNLRSKILHPINGRAVPRTIMVTSAIPKEGKTFTTSNLGISLAQGMDQYALLVDCDLRKPSLASIFGMSNDPGLVNYLRDELPLSSLIRKTAVNKLSVLSSGNVPINPAELLSSARMRALVDEMSTRYQDRTIIFDSPPVLVAAESQVLAREVDGIILVVRQAKSKKNQIQKVIESIGRDKILGIVFNDHSVNIFDKSYESGYGYYKQDNA